MEYARARDGWVGGGTSKLHGSKARGQDPQPSHIATLSIEVGARLRCFLLQLSSAKTREARYVSPMRHAAT